MAIQGQGGKAVDHRHVAVIGAGIIGVSTALQLAEKGYAVTVIDRDAPCSGASFGNAGVISPWSCVPQSMPGLWRQVPRWMLDPEGPLYLRPGYLPKFLPWALRFLRAGSHDRVDAIGDAMMALSRDAVASYRKLLAGTGGENLVRDSYYVHVYRHAAAARLDQLGWQMRQRRKVPLERIDAAELQILEPYINPEYQAAILIHGQGRAMDPAAIGLALAEKARQHGVVFRQAEVQGIWPRQGDGQCQVMLQGEMMKADHLVLAAGVWSARLLQPFGLKLPLEAERGYHLVCPDAGVQINNSVMDTERKCVASQMQAGVRVAGTAEFAGIEALPDYRRAEVFVNSLRALFPAIDTSAARPWMGRRPSFPDSLPCIGPIRGLDGVIAAFGHTHFGLSQAPRTGALVAACISCEPTFVPLTPYSPERF